MTKKQVHSEPIQPIQPQSDPHSFGLPERKGTGKKIFLVLITAIIVGVFCIAGTWYYMNKKAENQKKQQDAQIQELNQKLQELQKQIETANQTQTQTTTANSQTFNSAVLSFNYPTNWTTVTAQGILAEIRSPGFQQDAQTKPIKGAKIFIEQVATDKTSANFNVNEFNDGLPAGAIVSTATVTAGGVSSKQAVINFEGLKTITYVIRNGQLYSIHYEYPNEATRVEFQSVYAQVLSTLKFK